MCVCVCVCVCVYTDTNWSCDHLECDRNTQDLSSVGTDLVELHDRPRSVGRTEVFMECDWGLRHVGCVVHRATFLLKMG